MHRFLETTRSPSRSFHGSALPILRKNPDDRTSHLPRAQRHQSQVAPESADHASSGGRSDAPRARMHPVHPLGQAGQAGSPRPKSLVSPKSEVLSPKSDFG